MSNEVESVVAAPESSSHGGVVAGVIVSLVLVCLLLIALWVYRYRMNHGKLSVR